MTNCVLIRGELSSPPEIRLLDSGTRLAQLQVRATTGEEGKRTSVPVAVWDPADDVESLTEGDELVLLGHVERRFFRTKDGLTGSRVEVIATHIAPASDRRRCAVVVRRARAAFDA